MTDFYPDVNRLGALMESDVQDLRSRHAYVVAMPLRDDDTCEVYGQNRAEAQLTLMDPSWSKTVLMYAARRRGLQIPDRPTKYQLAEALAKAGPARMGERLHPVRGR